MTHLASKSLLASIGSPHLVAGSLCLAIAANAGCLDDASHTGDAVDATEQLVTAPLLPDYMWANSSWFVGNGGTSSGYAQVRFEYTNSAGVHDIVVPIDSTGGFTRYMPSGSPYNGDVVHATWSGGGLDDVGCDFVYRYFGGGVYSFADMGCVVTARTANVVVNEILANEPGSATAGEFIELVNLGNGTAQLGGWTLADAVSVRHGFAPGTTLAPGRALVVFGGASAIPAGLAGAVAASTGTLGLNNTGDTVTLRTATGEVRAVITYGSPLSATDGVSMNLSPEGAAGGSYVLHSTLSAAPASPGARSTGAAW